MDEYLANSIYTKHHKTSTELSDIWYKGYYESRKTHYHDSIDHFLNLHSFFI